MFLRISIAIFAALVIGSLVGHLVHVLLHRPWSGPLYRAHCDHHFRAYPRSDVFSPPPYHSSGKASGFIWFPPFVAPPLLGLLYTGYCLKISAVYLIFFTLTIMIVGVLHGIVHDQLHLISQNESNTQFWRRLRAHHVGHHADVTKNLGILWFTWDHIFGTYRSPTQQDQNAINEKKYDSAQ